MRLIDADKLIQCLRNDPLFEFVKGFGITGVINAQPTVDAQSEIDRLNRLGLTWYDTILKLVEMVNGTDQWIPCSERLPVKTGHYLCSFKKPNRIDNIFVDLAYWTGGRWYGYLANEINAWMPLPDRYEEEEECRGE